MVGYGKARAQKDPSSAFSAYFDWGLKGIGMKALEKLPDVVSSMPATADFEAMDMKVPRTEQHVAVAVRDAIYERWSEADAQGMITYLVKNDHLGPSLVSGLQKWRAKDRQGADQWMDQVLELGSGNPAWNSVHGAKAKQLLGSNEHAVAWHHMMQITDFPTKRNLQAQIFNAWVKVDPKSLKKAQKEFATLHAEDLRK